MYIKAKENYFESVQGFINYNTIYNSLGGKKQIMEHIIFFKFEIFLFIQ